MAKPPTNPEPYKEDPNFPDELKLAIIREQERPEMNIIEPDDDDPDLEGLDISRRKPTEQSSPTTPTTAASSSKASSNTAKVKKEKYK